MKTFWTERFIRSWKPAAPGKRTVYWDAGAPGLQGRVTDTGSASVAVMARIKGQADPVRRKIGISWQTPWPAGVPLPYPLAQMRKDNMEARREMQAGADPKAKWQAEKQAEEAASRGIFDTVADDFIAGHVSKLRSAHDMAATIRKDIVPAFTKRLISSITVDEVARVIKGVAKDRPAQARTVYHHASKLWAWAIAQRCYGVTASPFTVLAAKDLLGRAPQGDRVLSDSEQKAVWEAAAALGYPGGAAVHILQLTGLRRLEGFALSWPEIDLPGGLITIPGSRMKGGAVHILPICPMAREVLESLPGREGFCFSTTNGKKPISFFSKLKARLPKLAEPWSFHDLRRSFRTGLSMLNVSDVVSELCLAHAQRGLHKTYDRYGYLEEKRQALVRWETHMRAIVTPPESNVINLLRDVR